MSPVPEPGRAVGSPPKRPKLKMIGRVNGVDEGSVQLIPVLLVREILLDPTRLGNLPI